jgi:hypothetical protein
MTARKGKKQALLEAWGVFPQGQVTIADALAALPTEAEALDWIAMATARSAHRGGTRPLEVRRVARAGEHCAVTVPEPHEVLVGKTKKIQTWYGWMCNCGEGSGSQQSSSHESMALEDGAMHVLTTTEDIPVASTEPQTQFEAVPTAAEFAVSQGRQGARRKSDGVVTWTVHSAGEVIVRMRVYAPGWKVSTKPVVEAVAAAYGVDPARVTLKMGRTTSEPPTGKGAVFDWTAAELPVTAERAPEVQEPAGPPQQAAEGVAGAVPATVDVPGRGMVEGWQFELPRGSRVQALAKSVRKALFARSRSLGAGFTVTGGTRRVSVVLKEGDRVTEWGPALEVAAEVLREGVPVGA